MYFTNLIQVNVSFIPVRYLTVHQDSKVTIYAKVKYNKLKEFSSMVISALKKTAKQTPDQRLGDDEKKEIVNE